MRQQVNNIKYFLLMQVAAILGAQSAFADCVSPAATAGRQRYDSGTQTMFFCDGTGWQSMKGNITGQLRLGDDAGVCNSTKAGTIRYNTTSNVVEYCNGTAWTSVASAGGASADPNPDAFTFTDLTSQPMNSLVFSNIVTITGFIGPVTVQISGAGNPSLSVNGSSYTTSNQINPGDTLQVRMTTASTPNVAQQATITIGTTTDTWSVTTRTGGTRMFLTEATYRGAGIGGIENADAICQNEAVQYGIPGSWIALISTTSVSAASRVNFEYPVVNVCNGSVIENSDMWGSTHEGVVRTVGGCSTNNWEVWTGSTSLGALFATGTCDSWYGGQANGGRYGWAHHTASSWISSTDASCGNYFRLYCIPTDPGVPPDPLNAPNAFSFTSLTNQELSTLVTSNTITLSGFTGSLTASISGAGGPRMSVNGGAYTSASQTVNPGDTIQLQMTTHLRASFVHTATLRVGATSGTWQVTTKPPGTRIFVTEGIYRGSNLGGIENADMHCRTEAAVSGYTGNWKALMSTQNVNARDRLTVSYPVVNACTNLVVARTDLWAATKDNPVYSASICTNNNWEVWTGSSTTGNALAGFTCDSWFTVGGTGQYGWAHHTSTSWISSTDSSCANSFRLYCVSQPDDPVPNPGNTPNAFSFTNVTNQDLSASVVSNQVTLSGFTGSVTVSVRGPGSPQMSLNGGAYSGLSQTINSGDTLRVRVTTVPRADYQHNVVITAGATSTTWQVTTKAAGTLIFVTTSNYTGAGVASLANADSLCTTEAASFGYGGTWKAMLSDATTDLTARITIAYPVVNLCNSVVVEISDIWNTTHEGLIYTLGTCSNNNWQVWTGTGSTGLKAANTCTSWTGTGNGNYGWAHHTTSSWINSTNVTCTNSFKLYCVSQ